VQRLHTFNIQQGLAEDVVWRDNIAPILGVMPENVLDIWHYGFTEIFNNAIDHSSGSKISVQLQKDCSHYRDDDPR